MATQRQHYTYATTGKVEGIKKSPTRDGGEDSMKKGGLVREKETGKKVNKSGVVHKKEGGMIKGLPESPITVAKRDNGIPGYKHGGKVRSKK
jgi:hypothetical protein